MLGADDKAGVAEIMDAAHFLIDTPRSETRKNKRVLFTPDEEIGRGADKVDMKKLNADLVIHWMEELWALWKTKLSVRIW